MGLPAAIGPYAVVRELGRGGMGVVYEVRHPRSPRPLALKMLLHADERSTSYERFTREAIALARVRHPNVVGVLTYDRAPDGPYLVTELVEGTSLRALAVPLEPRRAAQVVRALADALVALHAAGVLHRDLKPENAILRPDGTPVLLDFGLAREHEARTLTEEGTLLGTPAYMAPEQLGDGRSVDARVDVYGLGAVLLFLLTGAPPFAGSHLEVLTRVLRAEPGWPKGAPPGLLAVLRRAMAKERDARHPSAAALRDDLDRWLAGGAPSGPGRARGCLALLGLLAALAVVSGAWVAARVGAEPGRAGGEAPVGTAPVVSAPPAAVRSAPPDEQDEPDEPDEVQAAAVGSAGRWTPRAAGPHPRYDIQHAMSWDPRREVVWLFGGLYKDVESATVFADLWSWDGEGWKEHATTGERGVPEGASATWPSSTPRATGSSSTAARSTRAAPRRRRGCGSSTSGPCAGASTPRAGGRGRGGAAGPPRPTAPTGGSSSSSAATGRTAAGRAGCGAGTAATGGASRPPTSGRRAGPTPPPPTTWPAGPSTCTAGASGAAPSRPSCGAGTARGGGAPRRARRGRSGGRGTSSSTTASGCSSSAATSATRGSRRRSTTTPGPSTATRGGGSRARRRPACARSSAAPPTSGGGAWSSSGARAGAGARSTSSRAGPGPSPSGDRRGAGSRGGARRDRPVRGGPRARPRGHGRRLRGPPSALPAPAGPQAPPPGRGGPEGRGALHARGHGAARVRHPNVVTLLAYGRAPEGPFLVTELVPGTSLRALPVPLDPGRAAAIVRALADGLAAVHAAGVLHRDLKPENALLRDDGQPVLIDFGLSREQDARTLTADGALLGTPAYMPPEQLGASRELDARADVYGLGGVLFFLLAGRPPFQGVTPIEVLSKVTRLEPAWPKDVPPGLLAVLRRAMAKEREGRPADAAALRDELGAWLAGGGRGGGRTGLLVGALLALLLLLGAGTAAALRPAPAPPAPPAPAPSEAPPAVTSEAAPLASAGPLAWEPRTKVLRSGEAVEGPCRRDHIQTAMTWDGKRGVVWLFGGLERLPGATPPTRPLGDLWSWDGARWTSRPVRDGPPARFGHAVVHDARRDVLVVLGGFQDSGKRVYDAEVWELELGRERAAWTHRRPQGPGPRIYAAAAWSAFRGATLLYGGTCDSVGAGVVRDLWAWDGSAWTEVRWTGEGPPPMVRGAMAQDPARDRLFVFGGKGQAQVHGALWVLEGGRWSRSFPGAACPARLGHLLVHDGRRLLVFGGSTTAGYDEYSPDGGYLVDTRVGEEGAWRLLEPGASPPRRTSGGGCYDPARREVVLFGGVTYDPLDHARAVGGGTWVFPLGRLP